MVLGSGPGVRQGGAKGSFVENTQRQETGQWPIITPMKRDGHQSKEIPHSLLPLLNACGRANRIPHGRRRESAARRAPPSDITHRLRALGGRGMHRRCERGTGGGGWELRGHVKRSGINFVRPHKEERRARTNTSQARGSPLKPKTLRAFSRKILRDSKRPRIPGGGGSVTQRVPG